MPDNFLVTSSSQSIELALGTRNVFHWGWEEQKPKRFHPEKLVQSLVYQNVTNLSERQSRILVFGGANELSELKRQQFLEDFPSMLVCGFEEDLYWQTLFEEKKQKAIIILGSTPPISKSTSINKYCESIRALYPTWYRPLRDYVLHGIAAIEQEKKPALPILLQERPGRFFELQIFERTAKLLRKSGVIQKIEERENMLFPDLGSLSSWGTGILWLPSEEQSEGLRRVKITSSLLRISRLWKEMDSFGSLARAIGQFCQDHGVPVAKFESVIIANMFQEHMGVIATYLKKYFNVDHSQFRFPDQIWGANPLMVASRVIAGGEKKRLLLLGQGLDRLRLVIVEDLSGK